MQGLTIGPDRGGVCAVLDTQGLQVGNLKLIGGRWKFKAMGHDDQGQVIPGGGPLTERHNMSFERLDCAEITNRLLGG
ncbi:MAG: hypothetical protein Q8M80_08245 [Hydrogenophaga sp.]|uniref:hypothetical protein n=1 Tax=Hydrogenophaga sp. TaxID=1904254 RepID=UPI0025BF1A96|nr:hypothetical protein [Hydrogenophaga sp.]MDO9134345.1 hypothetical protein [Hydrogenophaga sp.]MDO9506496.1 hypothetical protein [Hydrogenophaga sp.]MDP2251695.1 hypothetical protein [Hydrogenophaga sp.]MDP2985485.1 hypothetical protein [Hydrogenophaga sp.]MDP3204045.1 hypothetical protein [Hydrogenophaga sp.]